MRPEFLFWEVEEIHRSDAQGKGGPENQCIERGGRGGPSPEHADQKHRGHRRREIRDNTLQQVEKIFPRGLHGQGNAKSHYGRADGGYPADVFYMVGRCRGIQLPHINVEREDRAKGIKPGIESADQGRDQYGDDQTDHSRRQIVGYHGHKSLVGIIQAGMQHEAEDPWQDKEKRRGDFQKPGEQRAKLPLFQVAGGQYALHDGLIGAPEPDAEHGIPQ